ncbi:hypothetical protein ACOSQ4_005363 [Xanthoceras sorbifolium]
MADWAEFNVDLLVEIARRIKTYEDFIKFSLVCSPWKSAALRVTCFNFPWLILPPKQCSYFVDFFIASKDATCTRKLSQVVGKKYYSSKGWLMTISQHLSMHLLHPFSLRGIDLPHLKTFKDWEKSTTCKPCIFFISKFFLSANPSLTSDYTVMVIQSCRGMLAYYRPGDKVWTTIDTYYGRYFDITHYKGLFYALDCCGRIMVCNIKGDHPTIAHQVAQVPFKLLQRGFLEYGYIVESGGKLLVISREGTHTSNYGSSRFQVFEVDLSTMTLSEIKHLGNRALFLGHNSSFSVDALTLLYCKPNCIYFTDDCTDGYWTIPGGGGKNMGIYNLQDESVVPVFSGNSLSRVNPPMWVEKVEYS